MHTEGEHRIDASPERVWQTLHDPEVLRHALPACQSVTGSAAEGITAEIAHKVGAMPLSVTLRIAVVETDPGRALSYEITGRNLLARGARAEIAVDLAPEGGATRLRYAADVTLNAALRRAVGTRLEAGFDKLGPRIFERLTHAVKTRAA